MSQKFIFLFHFLIERFGQLKCQVIHKEHISKFKYKTVLLIQGIYKTHKMRAKANNKLPYFLD